ncbi:Putative ferrous iron permease EfeU [Acidipropionibacterium acidipropionici ATCC 4875]|uniref:Ferrous iron permease EfeU n=1 Tax=Acidipropionibacterium acidipropionici (strain ATCC 4875 / DSM 20272 / JCM 6432 / NBRC 12425 / NCIMB 8070 / 4) TaxID=1171373 RepID=K7S0V7_ACIA4|nr:iron uptake transporter permease EfeU [Acidipropionibacterium acidipropionici]AFV90998.1 Putative ferrous iron permease EfeU [Acidipropionibacterium acidipropionici ATCC 4875]ALN14908.1 iron transporter [Acidipropionibacterium acidipropionici]APZ09342.1 iron transporter [Acidipropionibacterium acidipropionici]
MFVANLLIALREGFEASLVVGIIAAYLVKAGRRDLMSRLWIGVGLAALIPLGVGAILTWGPKTLTFQAQEILGGGLSLVAVAMVTWMVFWMGKNSRQLKHDLESDLTKSLQHNGSGWGVVWIAILAVGREGVETALFIWATVKSSVRTSTFQTTAGVLVGLALAVLLGWAVYRGAVRINMHRFFALTGGFLILVAAGIVSYGIGDLQEAGVLPGIMTHAWDFSAALPASTSPVYWLYVVLVAMFQVNLAPTVLQAIAWWVYLVPVMTLFIAQVNDKLPGRAVRAQDAPAPGTAAGSQPPAERRTATATG